MSTNVPIMRVYEIHYYAPKDLKLDDKITATSSVEAIKKFVIATKGRYNVSCAVEVN